MITQASFNNTNPSKPFKPFKPSLPCQRHHVLHFRHAFPCSFFSGRVSVRHWPTRGNASPPVKVIAGKDIAKTTQQEINMLLYEQACLLILIGAQTQ